MKNYFFINLLYLIILLLMIIVFLYQKKNNKSLFGVSNWNIQIQFHFSKSLCIINFIDIILFLSLLTICKTVLIRSNALQTRFIISPEIGNWLLSSISVNTFGVWYFLL